MTSLVDRFGREVRYLRMSVTDRCDFRCVYCMDEEMTFVPRDQVLSLEELALVARAFTQLGVQKIRLTGGEPLIRRNILSLCRELGRMDGLEQLVMTTNGSQLQSMAGELSMAGVKRLNISLDSLRAERFKRLTRTGNLQQVLSGIEAAKTQGFERIKLNAVILKGRNDDEVIDLVRFALDNDLDISFIEEMPLGQISEHDRQEAYISSDDLREMIEQEWSLDAVSKAKETEGPSRYFKIAGRHNRIGFISPHSHNFCADCNRVRLTAEGRLLLCLGNEHSADLRAVVRKYPGQLEPLKEAIVAAMDLKPEKHYFDNSVEPTILRFMNATGG